MMYNSNLVTAIKVNGRILRESGDAVTLPFGSEYSILIKNLNSVRAQVSVSVDGTDATDGQKIIIGPNSSFELERFIRNGNLQAGNKFKFIERSGDIEKHRGIGSDDGLIRVEGWKEHVTQYVNVPVPRYVYPRRTMWPTSPLRAGGGPHWSASSVSVMNFCAQEQEVERSDAGITVAGSQSNQQFHSVSGFPVEPQSIVMVLHLRGEVGGEVASAPITVKEKLICSTCGKSNTAISQFCGRCGTALTIL